MTFKKKKQTSSKLCVHSCKCILWASRNSCSLLTLMLPLCSIPGGWYEPDQRGKGQGQILPFIRIRKARAMAQPHDALRHPWEHFCSLSVFETKLEQPSRTLWVRGAKTNTVNHLFLVELDPDSWERRTGCPWHDKVIFSKAELLPVGRGAFVEGKHGESTSLWSHNDGH